MKPLFLLIPALILTLAATTATASTSDELMEQRFKEFEGEFLVGPTTANIAGQASLNLTEGLAYVRRATLEKISAGTPQKWPAEMDGLILPDETGGKTVADPWGGAVLFYTNDGHVDDKDAQKLDAATLLRNIKKNSEKNNEERIKTGQTPLEVLGWHSTPSYNVKTHQLQWSLRQRDKGKPETERVIFSTVSLGREGSLNFMVIISKDKLAVHGHIAEELLSNISFNPGRRYADFDPDHDKKAKSTLTSLIEQADGMHLGLIAIAIGLLAKFGKVIAVVLVGGIAAINALKKRKTA